MTTYFDLRDPTDCRNFLLKLRVGKREIPITHFETAAGKMVSVEEAFDSDVMSYALKLAALFDSANTLPV